MDFQYDISPVSDSTDQLMDHNSSEKVSLNRHYANIDQGQSLLQSDCECRADFDLLSGPDLGIVTSGIIMRKTLQFTCITGFPF